MAFYRPMWKKALEALVALAIVAVIVGMILMFLYVLLGSQTHS